MQWSLRPALGWRQQAARPLHRSAQRALTSYPGRKRSRLLSSRSLTSSGKPVTKMVRTCGTGPPTAATITLVLFFGHHHPLPHSTGFGARQVHWLPLPRFPPPRCQSVQVPLLPSCHAAPSPFRRPTVRPNRRASCPGAAPRRGWRARARRAAGSSRRTAPPARPRTRAPAAQRRRRAAPPLPAARRLQAGRGGQGGRVGRERGRAGAWALPRCCSRCCIFLLLPLRLVPGSWARFSRWLPLWEAPHALLAASAQLGAPHLHRGPRPPAAALPSVLPAAPPALGWGRRPPAGRGGPTWLLQLVYC